MSTISGYNLSTSTTPKTPDLPVALTAGDLLTNLTKVRTRLAANISQGRLSSDDVKDIAAKLKTIADAIKSDCANGVLTRAQVADLGSQLNAQNKQITKLAQDGKAQANSGPSISSPVAKDKSELAARIAKLRNNIATAMKNGAIVGDTSKGMVKGLNSIQSLYAKYNAKGAFTSTQLSDLSTLVDQASTVLRRQTAPTSTPSYAAAPTTTGNGLSLVDYLV